MNGITKNRLRLLTTATPALTYLSLNTFRAGTLLDVSNGDDNIYLAAALW